MKKNRRIKSSEFKIARKLISVYFPGSSHLLEDLSRVENVVEINSDGSIIEFVLNNISDERSIKNTIPVEGQYFDKDGELVTILLFVDDNERLFQMERFKYSGELIVEDPECDEIRIIGP